MVSAWNCASTLSFSGTFSHRSLLLEANLVHKPAGCVGIVEDKSCWILLLCHSLSQHYQVVVIGQAYLYKITSIDPSGNESEFSPIKRAYAKFPAETTVVSQLTLNKEKESVRCSWTYQHPTSKLIPYPYSFELYRSIGSGGMEKVATLASTVNSFQDNKDIDDGLYNYAVRVRFDNGWTGELSEIKSILISEGTR